jgi:hypothetical protein
VVRIPAACAWGDTLAGRGYIPTEVLALVVGYAVFLQVLVLFGGWLGPVRTGWKDLTTSYLPPDFEGARVWSRQYVRIQKRGLPGEYYNACVGAGRNGLQVQICWPFTRRPVKNLVCPSDVLIPWDETTAEWFPRRSKRMVEFHFRRQPRVTIRMSEQLARQIAAEAREQWSAGNFLLDRQP